MQVTRLVRVAEFAGVQVTRLMCDGVRGGVGGLGAIPVSCKTTPWLNLPAVSFLYARMPFGAEHSGNRKRVPEAYASGTHGQLPESRMLFVQVSRSIFGKSGAFVQVSQSVSEKPDALVPVPLFSFRKARCFFAPVALFRFPRFDTGET